MPFHPRGGTGNDLVANSTTQIGVFVAIVVSLDRTKGRSDYIGHDTADAPRECLAGARAKADLSCFHRNSLLSTIKTLTTGLDVTQEGGQADTNDTLEESYRSRYIMVDSGFSGELVVGDQTLALVRKAVHGAFKKTLAPPVRRTKYVFGAGPGVETTRKVLLRHRALGTALCDIVPGKLPLLAGRKLLKKLKVVLDFGNETIQTEINHKRIKQVGSAFLIALDSAATVFKSVGASMESNLSSPGESDAITSGIQSSIVRQARLCPHEIGRNRRQSIFYRWRAHQRR